MHEAAKREGSVVFGFENRLYLRNMAVRNDEMNRTGMELGIESQREKCTLGGVSCQGYRNR